MINGTNVGSTLDKKVQNLKERIEKRIPESCDCEEYLRKLELSRENVVSERRERKLANNAEKRKAEAKEHKREHVRKREEREEEEVRR